MFSLNFDYCFSFFSRRYAQEQENVDVINVSVMRELSESTVKNVLTYVKNWYL